MKDIVFDGGIQEIKVGGGVLRFNPSDPNVYARMSEVGEKIKAAEAEVVRKNAQEKLDGVSLLRLLKEADREIKDVLGWVFGADNDFDQIFGGVNIMSIGNNGERVITNFLAAITPIMEQGAHSCAQRLVDVAAAEAEAERAGRGMSQ